MSTCPHCQHSDGQVKVGRNESGTQRYLCQRCRRKYTPEPKAPGYPDAIRRQAVRLYVDGLNLRRIARQLGVVHQTAANWVAAHATTLPDTPPMAVHRGRIDLLEEHLRRDPDLFSRTFSHQEIYPPELGCHADESLALHTTRSGARRSSTSAWTTTKWRSRAG